MKKLKSIDFKALFINHGEKFGLTLIVLIVLLALGKTSWSRYAATPEELTRKAKDARDRFSSPNNRWPREMEESFKVVDFTDRADQLFQPLVLAKFEFSTPLVTPLYRKREQASEPALMAVEFLIAHAGQAILGVSKANSAPVGSGAESAVEPAAPTQPSTGFRPSNQPGSVNSATAIPGGSTIPATGITVPGQTAIMRSGPGAHAGAHGGPMGMPGAEGNPSGVAARGARYVAVRGVFPLQQQLDKYRSALKVGSADASSMFELLDFVLERQEAVAGPDPWDTKWETVSVESALEVLRECSDFDQDPVKTGVTDSVITMSLPYRLLEFWGDHATHPNIRDFQLKPEEMEKELKMQEKLVEEYEKANRQSEPKVKRRGVAPEQRDLRRMGQEMMTGPAASHNMENMMRGMAAPMTEGGGPRTTMTPAEFKERLTANGRLLLFRYFDFDVQPGKAYRYRVKLTVRNPNFERPPAEIVSPELAEGAERETPWSNISMPAVVPTSVNYFLKDVERDPSRDDKARPSKPVASISMFEWDTKLGTMVHDTLKLTNIGQFIWEKKKSIVVDAATQSYKDDVEVPFLTGDVLLDASGDFDIAADQHPDLKLRTEKNRTSVKLGLIPEAIVMTELGEMKELNPASERAKEQVLQKRVDDERNEFKKLKEASTQPGGAHDSASSNPYEQMMGKSAAAPGGMTKPTKKSPKKKGASAHSAP